MISICFASYWLSILINVTDIGWSISDNHLILSMQLWGVRSSYLAQQNSCPTANNHYTCTDTFIHLFATGLSLAVYIHVNISGASDSSKQKKGKNYISNKVAAYKAKMTDTALCSDLTFLLFSGCWIWSPHVGLFSCNKGGLVFFQPNFSSGSGCYWPF